MPPGAVNLSTKTILVYDLSGTFTHIAERLSRDFGRVLYFSTWQTGFSTCQEFLPAVGLENVERIADPFEHLDQFDMAIFTDVGMGGLQEFWRKEGIPVFGCGAAQVLEIDRSLLKSTLDTMGMATARAKIIIGIDKLRDALKKEKEAYVKFSFFRADFETFHHKNFFQTETWLNEVSVQLGPYGRIAEFLVEEPIKGESVEIGVDGYAVNGKMPETMLFGYEIKDACFLGQTGPLPPRLEKHVEQVESLIAPYKYTGILSTEVKMTDEEDYLIDLTCRAPSPPSEVECAMMSNFSEVIWAGANGRLIEPDYSHLYGACLILRSDFVVKHPLAVDIPSDVSDRIVIHGHFIIDGKDYAIVPEEFPEFGVAFGLANSVEDAVGEAIETAESVAAYQLEFSTSSFEQAIEAVKKGNVLGLDWHNVGKLKAVGA